MLLVAPHLFRWGLMGAGSRIMQLSKAWSAIGWDASALVCWKESDAAQWEAFRNALPGGLISPTLASFNIVERAYSIGGRLSRTRLLRDSVPSFLKYKLRSAAAGRWARALESHLAESPNELFPTLQSLDCIWCVFTGRLDAAIAARMVTDRLLPRTSALDASDDFGVFDEFFKEVVPGVI